MVGALRSGRQMVLPTNDDVYFLLVGSGPTEEWSTFSGRVLIYVLQHLRESAHQCFIISRLLAVINKRLLATYPEGLYFF